MMVFTDGQSSDSPAAAADAAKADGIFIIAVGIGEGIDKTELESIASSPSQVIAFTVVTSC